MNYKDFDHVTDYLDHCVDHGVTERRPIAGVRYVGFVVYPPKLGPVVLAIAHREGDVIVQDLIRDGLTIADAANLMKAYGITEVEGMESEDEELALATLGVIDRAARLLLW
jgi:hypothetical protein